MPTKVTRPALVSMLTPTLGRPDKHEALYAGYAADQWPNKELVVLDESREPSPFFRKLSDPTVRYFHEPGKPRIGGVTRIGAARNRLVQLARGSVCLHRDDDDWYDPEKYVSIMLERLGDADVAKLSTWRLLHRDLVYLWRTHELGGEHFAIRGDSVERINVDDLSPEEAQAYRDAFACGFGWAMVYRRDVALKHPFPETGTEDIPWIRRLRDAGARIVFVDDCAHLALHIVEHNVVHAEGGSPHWPQKLLGRLRDIGNPRMMGAGRPMEQLPTGKPVQIVPGETYRILALIKKSHSLASVTTRANGWGIDVKEAKDNVSAPGVEVPSGYRLVEFVGTGSKPVTLPWKAPKMLRVLGENSRVVEAWIGAGALEDPDVAIVSIGVDRATLGPPLAVAPVAGYAAAIIGGGRLLGAGAGSDFSSLDPSVQATFNSGPGQQLQAEGVDPGTIDGQKQVFAAQYAALLPLLSQGATSGAIASAAAQYVSLGSTQAGAQNIVGGLIAAAESGDASQIINAFTGVAIAEVGTAVAAGAVTAGVGAAIVAGISLVSVGLSDLFSTPPPVANVGPCGLNYKPSFTIPGASVACKQGTPTTAGPSSATWSLWRKFPDPSKDPWWFSIASVPQGQLSAIETTWSHGSWSDEWVACVENGLRPIDQACYENGVPVYARIDADNRLAWLGAVSSGNPDAVAVLPQLQKAWFAAWKANREYDFNGLQRQADWQVFQQVVARWNLARSPGRGFALAPVPFPPAAFLPSDPPDTLSCYMQMVIQDLQAHTNSIPGAGVYDPTTGRGVLDANGNVHINTGPLKLLPIHIPPLHLHPTGLGAGVQTHTLRNTTIALGGTAVAAAAGIGIYAALARLSYQEAASRVWSAILDKTTEAGRALTAPKLPLLGAAERRRR